VQERAGLRSRDTAVQVTAATLETLGERLSKTEREKLAAQLPRALQPYLFRRHSLDAFEAFSLEEFYNRVRARTDVGYPDAVKQAQAVVAVLQEAVSPGEVKYIFSELSAFADDYGELFGKKPQGPASPST
ncbi:MAG: DUF2267 domain-containing protein, partial [Candidatus Binatia bacterium]